MKPGYKKPTRMPTKPLIYADVYPNVIEVHKGNIAEPPTMRVVVHGNPAADLITETLLRGLRADYRVTVRKFNAQGQSV